MNTNKKKQNKALGEAAADDVIEVAGGSALAESETPDTGKEGGAGPKEGSTSGGAQPKALKALHNKQLLVGVIVIAVGALSYIFTWGLGSVSGFGVGAFSLLCPLGGLEALLSSKTFVPAALISLVVVCVLAVLFGRTWCAWGCPVKVTRGLLGGKTACNEQPNCSKSIKETFAQDKRLWVLVGMLLAAVIVGFPVFCLVCPVGLTFGTVISVIRLIADAEVTVDLIVFPVCLVVELVLMKRWCVSICPIGGLLSLFGRFARIGRPTVAWETCARAQGGSCHACFEACDEKIDLHAENAAAQLADCTRCKKCQVACPTNSVSLFRK